jgi:hypothetical protein
MGPDKSRTASPEVPPESSPPSAPLSPEEVHILQRLGTLRGHDHRYFGWAILIGLVVFVIFLLTLPGLSSASSGNGSTAVLTVLVTFLVLLAFVGLFGFAVDRREGRTLDETLTNEPKLGLRLE